MRNIPIATLIFILLAFSSCHQTSHMNQENSAAYTNSLIHETSPYLLQHAHNPVDWYPWGEEALEKAKKENKLLLISVGYSACHWCHVMEHESFEDTTVAKLMNKYFINVKVDREERPDVDQVYMNAVQLMTGGGGWPLNCMALPDGRPIYGGTYFPKEKWMSVLESLQRLKETDPEKLEEYASNLTAGVQQSELVKKNPEQHQINIELLEQKVKEWSEYWDLKKGGPNRAPKFPLPNNYQFLLEYSFLNNDKKTEEYVKTSLNEISFGGIFDQIGGGFARYSTDPDWKVPHFEKMLYDNAQLVSLYSQAFAATKNLDYKNTVYKTLTFIDRELTAPAGGFYSALDADSEGEEGKYYIWTKEELKNILSDEEYELISEYYNVNPKGLWENGHYILLRDEKSNALEKQSLDFKTKLDQISEKLLEIRKKRIKPGLDDKILTSWNAQMIEGYVDAYLSFGVKEYLAKAKNQMNFILLALQSPDGGLYHKHKEGKSSINGYLEDYAFTISALIKLYEATFDERWLTEAKALTNYSLDHFYDDQSGMFWYKSDLDPALIARKQENTDNVIPASNSVMAHNLFKLSKLLYNGHFEKISVQMLNNILPHADFAQSYSNWLRLALYQSSPYYEIAIIGNEAENLRREISAEYIPNKIILGTEKPSSIPLLKDKFLDNGTIFVCQNKTCQLPVNSTEEALKQINH